jgi:hypothetical protein
LFLAVADLDGALYDVRRGYEIRVHDNSLRFYAPPTNNPPPPQSSNDSIHEFLLEYQYQLRPIKKAVEFGGKE